MTLRERFESIPKIAKLIKDSGAIYMDSSNGYLCWEYSHERIQSYLNGAWWMFQESQKRIEVMV